MIAEKNTPYGAASNVDLIRGSDSERVGRDICHDRGKARHCFPGKPRMARFSLLRSCGQVLRLVSWLHLLQLPTFFILQLQPPMEASFIVLLYRYYLFGMTSGQLSTKPRYLQNPSSPQVIVIVSSAIICSAAAWNLPISQNADLYGKMAVAYDKASFPPHPQS